MPLPQDEDREVTDTGVRFLSWGENATRLYTGSSDGVVKVWDVTCARGDVFIKDLISCDSGIMSGAFSPDYSKLLIGEVNGSLDVLEVGKDDQSIKDMERLKHIDYLPPDADQVDDLDLQPAMPTHIESGEATAKDLITTGQMKYASFSGLPKRQALQGPNYAGPFDNSVDAPYLREQALEFQYNVAKSQGPQCDIASCKDNIIVTSEEIGDSRRSADRIPDELREQWQTLYSDVTRILGKSRCSNCGRPARPSDSSINPASSLCERCSFTCFRCGAMNGVKPATEKFACRNCFRVWSIGTLGYECIEETGCTLAAANVPKLNGYKKTLLAENDFLNQNASHGDEMNALTDYYHSLTVERPETP